MRHNYRSNLCWCTRSFNELHQKINIIVSVYYLITDLTIICKNKMFVSINWNFYYPFPELVIFFLTEKHIVLSSEKSFMNIMFRNFLINSKQLMIFTINANVLSSKIFFMNIRFLKNSLINTDIFNFSNVLFFLTQIYLPLTKSTRKLIIAKKTNI